MNASSIFQFSVNTVLLLHVLFVAFVVLGLLLIYVGRALDWSWIRNPIFRITHLCAIGIVTTQAWFGIVCPLTTLENLLREKSGDAVYNGTFMSYWLQKILYYHAPDWVFIACYTAFGTLVLASWFLVRPYSFSKRAHRSAT